MHRARRRLLLLLAALPLLVLGSALLYQVGMAHLEGAPRGFWDSLSWAGETITTTGYGADSRWRHPAMVLFVVVLEPDEAVARQLFERGQPVLHRGLSAEALRAARLGRARASTARGPTSRSRSARCRG